MAKLFGLARLGRDAELRYTTSNEPVATLSLAFSFGKPGADGNRQTQWVKASIWGKRAESLSPHLLKGGLVSVTLDEVHIETFEGKNGAGTNMVGRVMDIEFASKKESSGESRPEPQQAPRQTPQRTQPKPQASSGFDDMDDDMIPF